MVNHRGVLFLTVFQPPRLRRFDSDPLEILSPRAMAAEAKGMAEARS